MKGSSSSSKFPLSSLAEQERPTVHMPSANGKAQSNGRCSNGSSPPASSHSAPSAPVVAQSPGVPNSKLDREATPVWEALLCVGLLIALDVGKLSSGYGLRYHSADGKYPIQQTLIVFFAEVIKLSFAFIALLNGGGGGGGASPLAAVRLSPLFAVPSIFYAITNNLTYYAFHYTTPAVWLVLTQVRVLVTALVYRCVFGRPIARAQWFALIMLMAGIALTKVDLGSWAGSLGGHATPSLSPVALVLALLCSVLSVAASISMEYLFKNDRRPFMEQQLQLYLFSSLISLGFCFAESAKNGAGEAPVVGSVDTTTDASSPTPTSTLQTFEHGLNLSNLITLLLFSILMSALAGLATATVIKRLDNIVKIYAQGLCGVFNAILCSLLFPDKFTPDVKYALSLALVLFAIFIYERKQKRPPAPSPAPEADSSRGQLDTAYLLAEEAEEQPASKDSLTKKHQ